MRSLHLAFSFSLAFLPALAACSDDGISFVKMDRCADCGPGAATRGIVMQSGPGATTAAMRTGGGLFLTRDDDAVFTGPSMAPSRGFAYDGRIDATAIRDDDAIALVSTVHGSIWLANDVGEIDRTIDASGLVIDGDSDSTFFSGTTLVVSGIAQAGATLAGEDVAEGEFVATFDSATGSLRELLEVDSPFASSDVVLASAGDEGDFLAALDHDALAALSVATPPSPGYGAGVVLHTRGVPDRLVAWVSSASPISITATALTPDGGVALAGRSSTEPFTLQQTPADLTLGIPFVAIVNPEGNVRWIFALPQPESVEVRGLLVSEVDASVFAVSSATSGGYLARLDTAGLAWSSSVEVEGANAVPRLLGVKKSGNVLVGLDVRSEDGEGPGAVVIQGASVVSSRGYGVLEFVR